MSSEEGEVVETPTVKKYEPCTSISSYSIQTQLGEGTFGLVSRARAPDGTHVALKKIVPRKEDQGFPITALREIRILKSIKHTNIVELLDIAIESGNLSKRGSTYMVFGLMDHDLAGLLRNPEVELDASHIKTYMQQLLTGLEFLHRREIIHRDLKGLGD